MNWPRRSKYGNKKTEVDGVPFDSKAEAQRYRELKLMAAAGVIRDLELQPRFELIVSGLKVCTYVADFRYFDVAQGASIVADVKGKATDVYRLKAKLMRACHGIEVQEWPPRKPKPHRAAIWARGTK
jgi:hypothetical protein